MEVFSKLELIRFAVPKVAVEQLFYNYLTR